MSSTHSGEVPHNCREQESAICEPEGKTSLHVSHHLVCCVVVDFIILGDLVPEETCEIYPFFKKKLKESLLHVADYCHRLFTET